ncbi:MAG TPA: hypothetical protein PKD91_12405 [Bacteroidia bacterium]|nr:hypothetical protein [Bacteroidia bacterium]
MRKYCLFVILLTSVSFSSVFAQSGSFEIHIIDNASMYNNRMEYHITCDSLLITGLSDYGRTPVRYHQRKLTKKECRNVKKFLHTFPIDSLDDLYNNEFNPADYSDKGYYPRLMEITVNNGSKSHYYRTVNCWVRHSDNIIQVINPLIPSEVRIKYNKADFNAFY